jgi:PAS domain S-box-containing protein
MSERTRILLRSAAILVIVSVAAAAVAMGVLYQATFEQHRDRLIRIVMHRADILGTVAEFDAGERQAEIPGATGPTETSRLLGVYRHFARFGETGEFVLARRAGDQIVWLLSSEEEDAGQPPPTSFGSEMGRPMQRALNGESGTMVGLDYRGNRVLAAYQPVPELGWGVVAKIDIAEILEPFLRAGLVAGGIALILVAAGVALNLRFASPLIQRIEERVEERTAELSEANLSLEREIAERQQTEMALRRMSRVFREATVPMSIQDLSGRITDTNPEVERTYGWSRDDLIGQPVDKIVPPEHRQQQRELVARCKRGEQVVNVEGWRRSKSGEDIPVLLTHSLLTEGEEGDGGIVTIAKDLTEQKRLEEQLRAAAGEATMAEERERRKLAVDLHDGVGQLLGLASMKLGALRTSVEAYGLDPEVRELEEIAIEVQERARSLVFQLSPPALHDVGLVAATHSLAEDMERRFGLRVTVEEAGKRQPLDETSRITLFRALSELLANVAKHAETKDARVRFVWVDELVEIAVEDDGVGFDARAPTRGYGLFSIRERLTRLGGSARIESSPGEGTRIVLTAPVEAAEAEDVGVS